MAFEIKQPEAPKKSFILNRALHLTADNKVVEEDDPLGVKVLGGAGSAFYEEEAKQYGLDDSHRQVEEAPAEDDKKGLVVEKPDEPKESPKEPVKTPEPAKEPEAPAGNPPAEGEDKPARKPRKE